MKTLFDMASRKKQGRDSEWVRIRYHLYQKIQAQVQSLLGKESPGVKKYRSAYDREFRGSWTTATKAALQKSIQSASMVMIGDFHAVQQSQRTQLRVLESLPKNRPVVLAVEFLPWARQKETEKFLGGELSEREFLAAVKWDETWGFSWDHYRPLVEWARKRRVPFYGLNRIYPHRDARTLQLRDRFSAEVLANLRERHPDALIVVIYGDLHLATPHLPHEVKKRSGREKMIRVFQNSERIYFELMDRGLDLKVDLVRLGEEKFCVLSVPPWVKWQNYLHTLETHLIKSSVFTDESIDYSDHVEQYLNLLAEEFDVPVESGAFEIYSAEEPAGNFWSRLEKKLSPKDLRWFRALIESSTSFLLPEHGLGYLARPSVNHAAQLAMGALYAQAGGWKTYPRRMPQDFLRLIWLEAILYFGSKLINPRRKTDTLLDIRTSLATRLSSDQSREILQLALSQKLAEVRMLEGATTFRMVFRPSRNSSYRESARLLGGMIGEKIYSAYREKLLPRKEFQKWLRTDLGRGNFSVFYFEMLELIESFPEPFLSKREKL